MNTISINTESVLGSVSSAIAKAASASGVDFNYLVAQARIESGLHSNATSRSSTASGLYQFIDSTWLAVLKQHGTANGLGWAADAIQWAGGTLSVRDPAARAAVLALKRDPTASAAMAGAHAADNKAGLEARLGRAVGSTELSLAHFHGLDGATRFLRAMASDPGAAAAAVAPRAASANRHVFFTHAGAARSLGEVYEHVAEQLEGVTSMGSAPVQARTPTARSAILPSHAYARAAYMLLAELGE